MGSSVELRSWAELRLNSGGLKYLDEGRRLQVPTVRDIRFFLSAVDHEFPFLQTRLGYQSHLQSEMSRMLTNHFLPAPARDAFSWGNGSLFRLCVIYQFVDLLLPGYDNPLGVEEVLVELLADVVRVGLEL